jgi:hypothetical protein
MKIHLSKLVTLFEIFPSVVSFDLEDLFSLDQDHDAWKSIMAHVEVKVAAALIVGDCF